MTGRLPAVDSPAWVGAGAVVAGSATYGLLVVVARALGPSAYAEFSLFWAAIVIVSLGTFLPVEQVLARWTARRDGPSGAREPLGAGLRVGGLLVVPGVVAHAMVWLGQGEQHARSLLVTVVVAFAVACAGFALQFPARGVLAGLHSLRDYAVVISVDAVLRAVVAGALWVVGVRSVGPYVATVAGSSLVCGVVGLVLVRRRRRSLGHETVTRTPAATEPSEPSVGREVGTLVVATLGMQLLLNSGTVVAGIASTGAEAVLAGHVLAVITLARLPVFVAQSAQASYVARIASYAHRGQRAELRRLLTVLAGAVLVVGSVSVLVAGVWGPPLVSLVFGPGYTVSWTMTLLLASGVAVYLVASVSNDVAVALGAQRRLGVAWVVGAAGAALVAVVVPDLVLRSALPLVVGSVVAGALILPDVVARVRGVRSAW
ncbi:lipopolysaccharide biosynthesis protein [Cellulomonas fimi]|uniref:Polysaccharide biosynthesis protein n=1 Tax=Cellulomonas fimi TaxID=1708 RepID=A0A7Y0LZM3_CELFI|nr:hypothetical protein [Cellulomonas fimi]NMR20859.1 hypothetical protein [Cellulomonas fimi]